MIHCLSIPSLQSLVCEYTSPTWGSNKRGWGARMMKQKNLTMSNQNPPNKKQPLEENESQSEWTDDSWPRFVVLESATPGPSLSKLSLFAIHKGILAMAGHVTDVKKLRSGQILVECATHAHARNLWKANQLAGIAMKASPHRSLNSSKGVIRTRELEGMDEDEIREELKPQGVVAVKRIVIRKDGNSIQTNTYILMFNTPKPPNKLKLGYLSIAVDLYISNPLHCFQCQKFGHGKNTCRNEQVCFLCGQKGHDNTGCQNPAKCSNCQGAHMAISRMCPVFVCEKQVQTIKAQNNNSYPEARKLVEGSAPNTPSYAHATKKVFVSVECQTDAYLLKDYVPPGKSVPVIASKPAIPQKPDVSKRGGAANAPSASASTSTSTSTVKQNNQTWPKKPSLI